MWFGNEQRMQWAPAPATGMQAKNTGFSDSLGYQTGGKGIVRTHQTHKEFALNIPVQEAAGLTGLDVYTKFASGFYGDSSDYPLFFADPMHYDQNLMPAGWASPGLYVRGWPSIAPNVARSYYNLATNPSVETNATGYTTTAGTSGTASGARTTSAPVLSGLYTYRSSWTVATSAVSGGPNYTGIPVNAGTSYDVMVHVASSKIQRVQVTVRFRNAGATSTGTFTGTQTVLAATTMTKLTVVGSTAPATSVTMDIEVQAVAGTSGANWANGDWMQIDGIMVTTTNNTPPGYFDGATPGAMWAGTANASTSFLYVERENPVISATPANSYNLPREQATWNVTSGANAYPTPRNTYGEIPYAIIPVPPGYTLHMGASGSATGTAELVVQRFNTPADQASPIGTTALTLLSSTGSTRLNATFTSCEFVKVFIRRTSTATSTITLSGIMAQLWPTGYSPTLTGDFVEGKGHRGLKFEGDDATVAEYVVVDRTRNVPVHLKGLSAQLTEAQDK
jgi:hypothetical protein